MQVIGVILVFTSLAATAWWIGTGRRHRGSMVTLCGLAVFAGVFFVLQERVTEITFQGFGTIKAAANQAKSDASEVNQIKRRVQEQSATIDLVAHEAADAKKLIDELSRKSDLVDQKLRAVDKTLDKASKTLSELETTAQFTTTVIAAQNDDRNAFEQLFVWANKKSHPFSSRAAQAWNTILDEHAKPFFSSGFTVPWREGLDPSALTLNELRKTYESAPTYLKPGLIEYVWNRENIPKRERMQFLAGVIQRDQSLKAVEYAGRYFTQAAELKLKPLAIKQILDWWKINKNTVK